jgi:hypothetical protein
MRVFATGRDSAPGESLSTGSQHAACASSLVVAGFMFGYFIYPHSDRALFYDDEKRSSQHLSEP